MHCLNILTAQFPVIGKRFVRFKELTFSFLRLQLRGLPVQQVQRCKLIDEFYLLCQLRQADVLCSDGLIDGFQTMMNLILAISHEVPKGAFRVRICRSLFKVCSEWDEKVLSHCFHNNSKKIKSFTKFTVWDCHICIEFFKHRCSRNSYHYGGRN